MSDKEKRSRRRPRRPERSDPSGSGDKPPRRRRNRLQPDGDKTIYLLAIDRETLRQRTAWIGNIMAHFLIINKSKSNIVCVLGSGRGEELLHLRHLFGPKAQIFAIDKRTDTHLDANAAYTRANIEIADYQTIGDILNLMPGYPTIIICRNPQIHERGPDNRLFLYNDSIADSLVEYAASLKKGAQMLITVCLDEDKDHLAQKLKDAGIKYSVQEPNLTPRELREKTSTYHLVIDKHVFVIKGQ